MPAMYSFSGPTSLPEFDLGPPSTSGHLQRAALSNKYVADVCHTLGDMFSMFYKSGVMCLCPHSSWEARCLRKHRRRVDDE